MNEDKESQCVFCEKHVHTEKLGDSLDFHCDQHGHFRISGTLLALINRSERTDILRQVRAFEHGLVDLVISGVAYKAPPFFDIPGMHDSVEVFYRDENNQKIGINPYMA